jgi:hypothetical protein
MKKTLVLLCIAIGISIAATTNVSSQSFEFENESGVIVVTDMKKCFLRRCCKPAPGWVCIFDPGAFKTVSL